MKAPLLSIFLTVPLLVVAAPKTVWDGVYTTAQAARGRSTYLVYCTTCHLEDLSGGVEFDMQPAPALVRDGFMQGRDLNNVFTFVKANMPADNAGTLSDAAYLDILAYVLQQNAFPAGSDELKADPALLRNIQIVAKPN